MAAAVVALLLTDVEGSTGLLVRLGRDGVRVLERVGELVTAVALEHGGHVSRSQGEGDSAVVLFDFVPRAVAACLALNELMAKEPWPHGDRVSIRAAVHIGEVTVTDDGVFGLEVHRCARLRALADGGEVLLSTGAVIAVRGSLPSGSSLRDEGLVPLKGLPQPERVWRLVDNRLRQRSGPLRVAAPSPAALPVWRNRFVGRSSEVESISSSLRAARVVTLVGPGGVGKTRLAVTVASQSLLRTCFVDLSGAESGDEVSTLAAEALGANFSTAASADLEALLESTPTLLVIDNCEHVLDAVVWLVERLLERCPTAQLLATSRAPLRVVGEHVVPVVALPTEAAVALFLDRARAVRPEAVVGDGFVDDVVAVADLLDGVPLALELAAARVNAFEISELLDVLRSSLAGLGVVGAGRPGRHRSLRAVVEWSIEMLGDNDRQALSRLAVLPGSFRLASAAAMFAADALPTLVEQSLVVREHGRGSTRYRLFEFVRAVALERLTEAEGTEHRDRLLQFCLEQLEGHWEADPPDARREADIVADRTLYVAAVEHAMVTDQVQLGLRLVHDLYPVWLGVEQRLTLDRWASLLVARTAGPSRLRGMVLRAQAITAFDQLGDHRRAMRLLGAADDDAVAISDRELLGRVRTTRANFNLSLGRLEGLEAEIEQAVTLLEETGDRYLAGALNTAADLYGIRGEFQRADATLARAADAHPLWFQQVNIELARAWLALDRGDVDTATSRAASALDLAERTGNADVIADSTATAGYTALARGDRALAREVFARTLHQAQDDELLLGTYLLAGMATVSALDGDLTTARWCRDQLKEARRESRSMVMIGRLACAFVDLVGGDPAPATEACSRIAVDCQRLGRRYAHAVALELLAACVATAEPPRARELLDIALSERAEVGSVPWPLEPYRSHAIFLLDGATPAAAVTIRS